MPSTPSQQPVRTHIGWRERLARLRGSAVRFDLSAYDEPLTAINSLESEFRGLSTEQFADQVRQVRDQVSLGCGNLHDENNYSLLTELNCALHAHVLLRCDVDYIVRNGRIEIVDEFTGRVVHDRHWPDGLRAAIEAKEGCIVDRFVRRRDSLHP